ncbi:MAG: GTPase ObgE [Clostridiales bacterium]|nr:GTPase ObgE [Clostridiales bacterium]
MFIDRSNIYVRAGRGGNGSVSFRREKYVAAGGPDGGDGGKGGDVVFRADPDLNSLSDFRFKHKFIAADGEKGGASHSSGKQGKDLIIKVPPGTVVKDKESGAVMHDMSDGKDYIAAKGGRGGWGNQHFATSTRQAPTFAKEGAQGEEREITLELRLIADVGLIGFPNVGKSSLISAVSRARPQVADYHFTTIIPVLGVVDMGLGSSFVIADIPGLIEGASTGAGLGFQFLRHIRRCRMFIHVVDVAGSEGRDPIEDYKAINKELEQYDSSLRERPVIVAGNKIDLATDEQLSAFRSFMMDEGVPYFEICAPIHMGTADLINAAAAMLATLPAPEPFKEEYVPPVKTPADRMFEVVRDEDGVFHIDAQWLDDLLHKINPGDWEAMNYFQNVMEKTGVVRALREAGAVDGDTVSVFGYEFEYYE